jgi:choline dehydrogenase-like flavoprotein/2-polyprenyl-3-methyl-5-hydroxy-6-metoxy-1,4-benzoquinol methylase
MENKTLSENPEKKEWDIIVIGAGMGGAVVGYALASAGKSVLFCEKGKSYLNNKLSLKGDYAENFFSGLKNSNLTRKEILAQTGRWSEKIKDVSNARSRSFIPFMGSGAGGSTALYGMALERFFPSDFLPKQNYPDAKETTLPEKWPISYDELRPYYETAEKLFRVRGVSDPLKDESFDHLLPLPPLTPAAKELSDFFLDKGLHPYRLPMACEFVTGCECCQSYLCNKNCKNDSARICLEPALTQYGAYLLDECEVLRLEEMQSKVTGVVCIRHNQMLALRGKIVVLAAGALETPKILLNSVSPSWPNGLANNSGLVGKNLMRHYIDIYAIIPKSKKNFPVNFKEIACNDYYVTGEQKHGTIQSFGAMPPASVLADGIEQELTEGQLPFAGLLFKLVKPIVKFFLARLFSRRIILATIMEDLPYKDNFVTLSDRTDELGRKQIALKYQIRHQDQERIVAFRKKISKLLKPYSFMLIKQAENNERIAHACGTCRFGTNPKESVLDAANCVHGISNLYIVDSSFFPSSGGTNPGLTIAANALRVAHIINKGDTAQETTYSHRSHFSTAISVGETYEDQVTSLYACNICGYKTNTPEPSDLGKINGNTERFKETIFHLWKCPRCRTIHSIDPVNFQNIYKDYPLNKRRMDFFAKITMHNLLKRLIKAGIKKTDAILDYGCGNGLFVQFLKKRGYTSTAGYDPFVPEFSKLPDYTSFDCIVANDVIEHATDPHAMAQECKSLLKLGGLLYIGTTDSEGVEMHNLKSHIMRLHQPFHRIIFNQETLKTIGIKAGLKLVRAYRRSYMDTWIPFSNYRFLDEFSKALGHNMDLALDPASGMVLLRRPMLWFYAFFGYFFPSAYEPAVLLRKDNEASHVKKKKM